MGKLSGQLGENYLKTLINFNRFIKVLSLREATKISPYSVSMAKFATIIKHLRKF